MPSIESLRAAMREKEERNAPTTFRELFVRLIAEDRGESLEAADERLRRLTKLVGEIPGLDMNRVIPASQIPMAREAMADAARSFNRNQSFTPEPLPDGFDFQAAEQANARANEEHLSSLDPAFAAQLRPYMKELGQKLRALIESN